MTILLIASVLYTKAEGGYQITVSCPQLANKEVSIWKCIGGEFFLTENTTLDSFGKAIFENKQALPQGSCLIRIDQRFNYDLLIGEEQQFTVLFDTLDIIHKTKIEGAKIPSEFSQFKNFVSIQKEKKESLFTKYEKTSSSKKKDKIQKQIEEIDQKAKAYFQKLINENQNNILNSFVKASLSFTKDKEHFFDSVEFTNKNLWNTPVLFNKVDQWLNLFLLQPNVDLEKETEWLLNKVKSDPVCMDYAIKQIYTFAKNSDWPEMENLRYYLGEKYILQSKSYLFDDGLKEEIIEEMKKNRFCRLGQKAKALVLTKEDDNELFTDTIQAKHLLLFFYEPDCKHCHYTAPILHDNVYKQFKEKGLEIIAICISDKKKDMINFIEQHNCSTWINAYDPEYASLFWEYYDITETPAIYLLDEQKRIIIKSIGVGDIENLLINYLKNK